MCQYLHLTDIIATVFGKKAAATALISAGNNGVSGALIHLDSVSKSFKVGAAMVPVLNQISLQVQRGEFVAVVGPSGNGKSTLANLVPRFYDVSAGRILLDGVDIRQIKQDALLSQIGIVPQETVLFSGTIADNIRYGVPAASDEEVVAAARAAQAHDFILELSKGYETHVEERGTNLSGGQKQRIAIARALLVNPKILLLDEATSALDAESESLVQDAIEKAMVGRTVLIVAHRLSTIRRAEQIVVLDQHQIVDMGTHDVLMARCTKYQDLIKRQNQVHTEAPPVHDEMEFS